MKKFDIITEADARTLPRGESVMLARGGHVTPLAQDTLKERRIDVVVEGRATADESALAPRADIRTVAIASDHTGVKLRQVLVTFLRGRGLAVSDLGTDGPDAVDYPDVAAGVARLVSRGEADAYGNRKLGGIGGIVSDYLEKRSHDKVIYQRLAYLMRSGAPDSLDQLVANNYGSLAADLMRRNETGKMVAVVDGRYTAVPIEVGSSGRKRVDIGRFYDVNNYRPKVADVMGMPLFLH